MTRRTSVIPAGTPPGTAIEPHRVYRPDGIVTASYPKRLRQTIRTVPIGATVIVPANWLEWATAVCDQEERRDLTLQSD